MLSAMFIIRGKPYSGENICTVLISPVANCLANVLTSTLAFSWNVVSSRHLLNSQKMFDYISSHIWRGYHHFIFFRYYQSVWWFWVLCHFDSEDLQKCLIGQQTMDTNIYPRGWGRSVLWCKFFLFSWFPLLQSYRAAGTFWTAMAKRECTR